MIIEKLRADAPPLGIKFSVISFDGEHRKRRRYATLEGVKDRAVDVVDRAIKAAADGEAFLALLRKTAALCDLIISHTLRGVRVRIRFEDFLHHATVPEPEADPLLEEHLMSVSRKVWLVEEDGGATVSELEYKIGHLSDEAMDPDGMDVEGMGADGVGVYDMIGSDQGVIGVYVEPQSGASTTAELNAFLALIGSDTGRSGGGGGGGDGDGDGDGDDDGEGMIQIVSRAVAKRASIPAPVMTEQELQAAQRTVLEMQVAYQQEVDFNVPLPGEYVDENYRNVGQRYMDRERKPMFKNSRQTIQMERAVHLAGKAKVAIGILEAAEVLRAREPAVEAMKDRRYMHNPVATLYGVRRTNLPPTEPSRFLETPTPPSRALPPFQRHPAKRI